MSFFLPNRLIWFVLNLLLRAAGGCYNIFSNQLKMFLSSIENVFDVLGEKHAR